MSLQQPAKWLLLRFFMYFFLPLVVRQLVQFTFFKFIAFFLLEKGEIFDIFLVIFCCFVVAIVVYVVIYCICNGSITPPTH